MGRGRSCSGDERVRKVAENPEGRRFEPYLEYQNSGVEWLGEIPPHWIMAPVYARFEVALGKMLDAKRISGDHLGAYVRNVDVQWDKVNIDNLPTMDFHPAERQRYLLREGDLLVCEGGEVGRTAVWRSEIPECFYQKAIHRVRPLRDADDPRFFYYIMYAASKLGVLAAGGNPNTIDHLTAVQLRHYRFAFPFTSEQRAIAAFLDRETAKIDALIEKKERLIELLQEKRTALITHAVTKGLDPDVPMKDSGVEWLGEIPAHWQAVRLRHVVTDIEQGWSPDCYNRTASLTEWAVLKTGCVNHGVFNEKDHKTLPETAEPVRALEIKPGDVLMSRASGSPKLIGSVAYVGLCRPRLMLSDKLFRLHCKSGTVIAAYLSLLMGSRIIRAQIEQTISGAGGLANNIGKSTIKGFRLPVPPLAKQQEILNQVTLGCDAIGRLVDSVQEAIGRLKEYRTALISAAVTGKIDVREEAA